MPHPIRGRTLAQMLRPGWSEFGQWRVGGKRHTGFDYYAPEGTPIYATGPGRVTFHGYLEGGWGHYVEVTLDDENDVRTVDGHMMRATPLRRGARVDEDTIIGYVGKTGNAAGIIWYFRGESLRHVHHEVRRGRNVHVGNVDPLAFHGSVALAGGSVKPILHVPPPHPPAAVPTTPAEPEDEEDDMKPKLFRRVQEGYEPEWTLISPEYPGGMRVTADAEEAKAWARLYMNGHNSEGMVDRAGYIRIQQEAAAAGRLWRAAHPEAAATISTVTATIGESEIQRLAVLTAERTVDEQARRLAGR